MSLNTPNPIPPLQPAGRTSPKSVSTPGTTRHTSARTSAFTSPKVNIKVAGKATSKIKASHVSATPSSTSLDNSHGEKSPSPKTPNQLATQETLRCTGQLFYRARPPSLRHLGDDARVPQTPLHPNPNPNPNQKILKIAHFVIHIKFS